MMRIKALQPFVGVWGNQSYVFSEGEIKDVPDGFGESVCRSGTLAVMMDLRPAPPVKAEPPAIVAPGLPDLTLDTPGIGAARVKARIEEPKEAEVDPAKQVKREDEFVYPTQKKRGGKGL